MYIKTVKACIHNITNDIVCEYDDFNYLNLAK